MKKGYLHINVISGQFVKDKQLIGKMDPYLIVKNGKYKSKTRVANNQGKSPLWNQQFSFQIIQYDNTLIIQAYQQDNIKDQYLGMSILDLDPIIAVQRQLIQVNCYLQSDNKLTGIIKLDIQYDPSYYGKYILKLQKGILQRDTQLIGKMDIFADISLGSQHYKTKVLKGCGKNPVFQQQFLFEIINMRQKIVIKLFDQDLTSDDFVAETKIRISQRAIFRKVPLFQKNKLAGYLELYTKKKQN